MQICQLKNAIGNALFYFPKNLSRTFHLNSICTLNFRFLSLVPKSTADGATAYLNCLCLLFVYTWSAVCLHQSFMAQLLSYKNDLKIHFLFLNFFRPFLTRNDVNISSSFFLGWTGMVGGEELGFDIFHRFAAEMRHHFSSCRQRTASIFCV